MRRPRLQIEKTDRENCEAGNIKKQFRITVKRKNLTVSFFLGKNGVKTLGSLYTNTGTALVRQELAKHHSLIDVTRFVLFKPPHPKAAKLRERRLGQNE